MTDTSKKWQPTAKIAKESDAIFFFNPRDPVICKYGHAAPRQSTNSQCLICKYVTASIQAKFKINLLTFYNSQATLHIEARQPIEIAAFQSAATAVLNDGYRIPVAMAIEAYERGLEFDTAHVEDGFKAILKDRQTEDAEAIEGEGKPKAVGPLTEDRLPGDQPPPDIIDEPENLEPAKPRYAAATAAEAFIGIMRPRVFTTNNLWNHLHRVGLSTTYSGANQNITKFKKRGWLVDRGRTGKSNQYATGDLFFFDQRYFWREYLDVVPKHAKALLSNFRDVLKDRYLEKTEDEILFDELDAIVKDIDLALAEMATGETPEETPPPPDKTEDAEAKPPIDLSDDQFEDGLFEDAVDAALVGRSILHYILELQADSGSAVLMTKVEDLRRDIMTRNNEISVLNAKIKRQAEVLTNYETQLKNEKHLNYQLKLRIQRLKDGLPQSGNGKKPPRGTFTVGDAARISKIVKKPAAVVRRRYNDQGEATSTELNPNDDK